MMTGYFISGGSGWVCIHPDGTRTPIWNVQWDTTRALELGRFQPTPAQVVHRVAEPNYVTWWNGSSCSMSWESDEDMVPQI
jgi:hypothetical protein